MNSITSFNQLVGNTTTITMIKSSLNKGKFPETVMFSGTMGTGKSTSAILAGMYLTCDNPNEDGPCMRCKTCMENLEALDNTGRGKNLVKINIGLLVKDKKNFDNLIKEIFVLEQGEGNSVYILEEMHAMDSYDQTALLEEIDRKAAGTYIIMCTTQPNKVIPELRSRAIKFNFSRLKVGESRLLLEQTLYRLGVSKLNPAVADIIIKNARGVPRDIINLVEFIENNQPTLEEVQEFLGQVSQDVLCSLIESCSQSIFTMSQELDGLLLKFTCDVIIAQLKDFLVSAIFATSGKIDELPLNIRNRLKVIGDEKVMYSIAEQVNKLDYNSSEADLKYTMIKVSLLLQKRSISSVYKDNTKSTSEQMVLAGTNEKEMENINRSSSVRGVKKLDLDAFNNFLEGGGYMRCRMRSEVELDEDGMADLRQLSTIEKITTSIRISFRNTKMAKNRRQREVEQAYRKAVEEEDGLKSVLLQRIYNELVRNNFLNKKGLHAKDITLAVDARMEDVLRRIIKHKDFVSYDITIIEPNADVKKCFLDTPILINVKKKVIMEESYEM